jgi:hypothetical protein
LINERSFAVINVRNDGDVADFIHGKSGFPGREAGSIAESDEESNAHRE